MSDNGSQYVNEVIARYTHLVGTEHVRITPHSHEENSLIERSHKETLRHLRALVFDAKTHNTWSEYLNNVQHIMNNSVHDTTGVAPVRLLFGNAISLDKASFLPIQAAHVDDISLSEWSAKQIAVQEKLLKLARTRQQLKDELHLLAKQNDLRNRKAVITIYPPGTYVKVGYPMTAMGQRAPHKLATHWRGPYEVITKEKGAYILRDIAKGTEHTVSEHLVELYHVDPKFDDPRAIALAEADMYDIAEVLDITGDPKGLKTQIALLIRWEGYDDEPPTWNTWNSSFTRNKKIHEFLRQKGGAYKYLIPKRFR
jgi:hypothetical protein